jgi:hypothetical protein
VAEHRSSVRADLMPGPSTGKSAVQIHEEFLARQLEQRLTVQCGLCQGRKFRRTGPAGVVMRLIAEHRAEAHPEVKASRRNLSFRHRAALARDRERLRREGIAA